MTKPKLVGANDQPIQWRVIITKVSLIREGKANTLLEVDNEKITQIIETETQVVCLHVDGMTCHQKSAYDSVRIWTDRVAVSPSEEK